MERVGEPTWCKLFDHWDNNGQRICVIASDGRCLSYAAIAALGAPVMALAQDAPALVFIEGRNTAAFVAAYVAAMRAGLAVHILDPARTDDNTSLEAEFRPIAVVATAEAALRVRLTGLPRAPVHPDLALLLPTSGTTGSSKMVKITARNIAANTAAIIAYLGMTADDCTITTLKPFYSFGLSVLNTHLDAGGRIVLNDAGIESPEFWQRATAQAVTNFVGVPHTFELLATMAERLRALSALRFLAQAGGRLAPGLVRQFAERGERSGWQFFVMYGQTEASPRISYLPPELAARFPNSIGRPIPGGRLWIADEDGREIDAPDVEGELHYAGPNVMAGYAHDAGDLGQLDVLPELATGDLARRLADGLFVITGRKSRFVKPFGLRVSLDQVEALLAEQGIAAAATAHDDGLTIYFVPSAAGPSKMASAQWLARQMRLPSSLFDLRPIAAIPLLANQKIDRRAIAALAVQPGPGDIRVRAGKHSFLSEVWQEFIAILHGRSATACCVYDIFVEQFGDHVHEPGDSFIGLGGDSLAAVAFAIRLEEMLGALPNNWPSLSISQLEGLRQTSLG